MRTTLTIEPDVAKKLKEYAHATRSTFKDAVNTLLRRGLDVAAETVPPAPFVVVPHPPSGLRPGIDPMRLKDFIDDEDAAGFLAKSAKP